MPDRGPPVQTLHDIKGSRQLNDGHLERALSFDKNRS